jgi:hypothetical protein
MLNAQCMVDRCQGIHSQPGCTRGPKGRGGGKRRREEVTRPGNTATVGFVFIITESEGGRDGVEAYGEEDNRTDWTALWARNDWFLSHP